MVIVASGLVAAIVVYIVGPVRAHQVAAIVGSVKTHQVARWMGCHVGSVSSVVYER